ncbi:MAG: sensor histidine kinase [Acidimicrobiia bacterium]|nr:sensor histidine kinase [Acidimicrobiia bacterium]
MALGFAATVIVLAAASTDNPAAGATQRDLDGWAALLLAVAGAFLVGGRRFPGTVALAVLGVSFVWYGVGYTSGLVNVATLVAFYCLGTSDGGWRTFAVSGAAVAALLVGMVAVGDESVRAGLTAAGYVLMAVMFGESVRNRQLLVGHLADRAARAEADAERRVVEERLRIARDVHDVLAHTVAVMAVQAEVAADALQRDPDAVRAAVHAIRQAGTEAMGDVRSTVAVLRSGGDPASTTPVPGIAELDELVDAARDQALDVKLDVVLSGRALPEMVELTAFRVVQEAITNVVRHARAASARVHVHEQDFVLVVEVHDDGHGRHPERVTAGFGLRGMAERVESVGGELWHGRHTDGGWVVRASLPLPVSVP